MDEMELQDNFHNQQLQMKCGSTQHKDQITPNPQATQQTMRKSVDE